jgi:hypothetical protein
LHSADGAEIARKLAKKSHARFSAKVLAVAPLRTADELIACIEELVAQVRAGQAEARVLTAVTGACKFLGELRGLTGARPSPEDAFDDAARNARRPNPWNPARLYGTDQSEADPS